jgi:hypothetical protein
MGPVVLGKLTRSATRVILSNCGQRVAFGELLENQKLLAHHQQVDQRKRLTQHDFILWMIYIDATNILAETTLRSCLAAIWRPVRSLGPGQPSFTGWPRHVKTTLGLPTVCHCPVVAGTLTTARASSVEGSTRTRRRGV